jgi:hypothetical protein
MSEVRLRTTLVITTHPYASSLTPGGSEVKPGNEGLVFVARIEEEQTAVQPHRRLIEVFDAKLRDRIKEVRGRK